MRTLVVNPGSSSLKVTVLQDGQVVEDDGARAIVRADAGGV